MPERSPYSLLPYEDRLLIDQLYEEKNKTIVKRKRIRDLIARLRDKEMQLTKEVGNLSREKIGEKFGLSAHSARPFSKREKEIARNNASLIDVKKRTEENKIRKHCVGQRAGLGALG